jgi:glutamate dehydrogenase/leucine dehydrogenase
MPKRGNGDRRERRELRELLDEMIAHVRALTREHRAMAADDLHYAQQRLEWLADEIWRSATEGKEGVDNT